MFHNKLLFHRSKTRIPVVAGKDNPGAPTRLLSWKRQHTMWGPAITVTLSLPVRGTTAGGKVGIRSVRSWSFQWMNKHRPVSVQSVTQTWMDPKRGPGPFRMNNGMTHREWIISQRAERKNEETEKDVFYKQIEQTEQIDK